MATTRITAGEWRGRVIDTPRGLELRPTRSMVRQSLFDILGPGIQGSRVLDLYAGAGTVGFEALSRGAALVTFVDRDPNALRLVAATSQRLRCAERCEPVRAEVGTWLRHEGDRLAGSDLAFIDAPYRDADLDRVLDLIGMRPPALVVCEHHFKRRLPERIGALERVRETRHGLTTLTFLHRTTTGDDAR